MTLPDVDAAVRSRLEALIEEGAELYDQFDRQVRDKKFHPFVAADYGEVLDALTALRASVPRHGKDGKPRFLEWGSATGVITILADLLGYEAYGIELDPGLVDVARKLAARYDSKARFVAGSFVPAGYRWKPATGDGRMGTIGSGGLAYPELGHGLDDFDLVYAYPWDGEEPMMRDLMRTYGAPDAVLLLMDPVEGLRLPPGY